MSHLPFDPRSAAHRPRQSRLAFSPARLVVPLLLCLLLLAQFVSQWSLLTKPAYAAVSAPVQSMPPSLTFAKYLKDNDAQARTLSAQTTVLGPGPFSLGGDPQNQMAPIPHLAEVQGNNGQLSYSYPLQVAPGSGGFAPQLSLNYSSIDPNDRHNNTSPADDAGDGWSLTLGSITADVYDGNTWYFLNGIDNVGDRLLLYDNTNKLYYTEHLSYLRIQQVTANGQPCFDVWDKSGTFYELGCTTDSLEYSLNNGQRDNYAWNVDRIVAPNEGPNQSSYKMIQVTYLQDCSTGTYVSPCPSGDTVRDAVIKQITYGISSDLKTLTTANTAGTIDLNYLAPFDDGSWASHYTYNSTGNDPCTPPASTSLRCDDPVQKSGGFTAPSVMGTFTLAGITSYLNTDGSSSNAAFGYSFSYSDTPFQSCTDPVSGTAGYCAGEHLLTQIQPLVYQSGVANKLPVTTFGYSSLSDTYYDSLHNGKNSQPFQNTTSWSYLNSYHDLDTGIGASVVYQRAYNNSDGTPTIKNQQGYVTDNRYDALYCTWNASDCSSGSYSGHYAHPDDQAWSVQVVQQLISSGKDSSSLSTATTSYGYELAYTNATWNGSGAWCYPDQYSQDEDCVGDNWISTGTNDWSDYYHGEFRGFAQVWRTSPSGDLTIDDYFSTEGWNSASTNADNYDAGQLQLEEVYQGSSKSASALLSQTLNTYPGPYLQNGDVPANTTNNPSPCVSNPPSSWSPYNACTIVELSSKTTEFNGSNSSNAPWVEEDNTYDDYNPSSGGLNTNGYHNLTQQVVSGSNLPTSLYPLTKKWTYTTNASAPGGSWTYYTVDTVTHSEVDDHTGHAWQCQSTSYDQGSSNPTPDAGWPTTVQTYSSGNCASQSSPLTTRYTDYDIYGNVVATVDPDGAALSSLYQSKGCTPGSTIAIANSAWNVGRYTTCSTYDSSHYQALPTSSANAFGQTSSYVYDPNQGNILQSSTDPNNQSTSYTYSYDNSGNRTIQVKEPGETNAYTTQTSSYSTCSSSSSLPCYEVDSLSYQYRTLFASTFYDSQGRAVETITPGPAPSNPQNGMVYVTVVFTSYNDSTHSSFKSNPFVIAVASGQSPQRVGYVDPNGAKDDQGNTPGGTATYDDALGRTIAVQDPLYGTGNDKIACLSGSQSTYTACINYSIGQVSGDPNYYATATSVDPDQHVSVSYLDALGRTVYSQQDSGTYGTNPSANEQTTTQYNVLDEPTSVVVKDLSPQSGQTITSVTTTAQYDDLGRLAQLADPDRGTHNYTYDADGRLTIDSSGSSPTRTIGYVYDLLGRLGCVQDTTPASSPTGACTGGNPYIQNTYDSSLIGGSSDFPIGQLTKSVATTYIGGTTATVTEKFAHDPRGQFIQENLAFGLPSAWNVSTALPTYKLTLTYNDANQVTTTTSSSSPSGLGYTSTQSYDSTTGVLSGLSNNSSSTPNLATLSYNAQALPSSLNYQTSSGGQLASEQLGYDGDLRVQSLATTWQGGSGNPSGNTILTQGLSYDPASNLINLTTTQASVPGNNNSGGTETQVFCYNEQNQLVWSGNNGTPSCSGNGSPSTSPNIAAYSNTFVYTHLGQLWQGPLHGGSTQYQYLYCTSSAPHQLTGLYSLGATCSNQTGQGYASSYDQWGNVTGRTYSGTTGTLTYDILDHLTQWYASSSNQEQYLYDASGNRVLRRSTNSTGTTIITYPFGLEEHQYNGSGTNQWNTYYYFLGSRLIGDLDANNTYFLLTDALGSILSDISWSAGGASVQGNQLFGPYGNGRYSAGSINTAKGFIGQYNDSLTGLDYFHARYYDPVAGVFLSADKVQGNLQGMDPYGYVNGNPETKNDPTGKMIEGQNGEYGNIDSQGNLHIWVQYPSYGSGQGYLYRTYFYTREQLQQPAQDTSGPSSWQKLMDALGITNIENTFNDPNATWWDKLGAVGGALFNDANNLLLAGSILFGGPELAGAEEGALGAEEGLLNGLKDAAEVCGGGLSFTPNTKVETAQGEQAIGTIKPGEQVEAYNPKTHKMELEPVLHVWINHDNDLVDLTLTTSVPAAHGKPAVKTNEVIHTNKKHPFLTEEKGFLPVGQIKLGMHVLRADGTYGVVTGWKMVPGTQVMYNLEVAQDHTFTVGMGQWVVHNCDLSGLSSTKVWDQVSKLQNIFSKELNERSLEGAWNDIRGFSSGVKSEEEGGIPFDHLQKVEQAINGAENRVEILQKLLDRGGLSETDQCIVQCIITQAQSYIDFALNAVYDDAWVPGSVPPPPFP